MIGTAPPPHRLVLERPGLYALVAAVSLLLSLWALNLNPVINSGGVDDVRAARYFLDAQWRAAIDTGGQPVYAILAAALNRVTGMSAAHALYALTAGFLALLAVGFVALASVLRTGPRTALLAALLVLLLPALNGVRSAILSDSGYWVFYTWSLAYFMHYAATRDRHSLVGWALAGLVASLFAIQALAYLLVVPVWMLTHAGTGGRGRLLKAVGVVVAGAVLLGCVLWVQALESGAPAGVPLLQPIGHLVEGWRGLGQALSFKMQTLSADILDQYSRDYERTALAAVLLALCAAGLVKALGLVNTVLAGASLVVSGRVLAAEQRYWWGVFAVLGALLLLVPALTRFAVDAGDAMALALTLLAVVPPALEWLWRGASNRQWHRRWLLPLALALVIGSGIHGLDRRGGQMHLREAGLWLRATAAPETSLYSNSPVVVYYSGLDGYRPGGDYSWQAAMRTVWRDRWRDHDYLALVISAGNEHREGILMRKLEIDPVRTFTGDDGGRVLIFDTRR